MEKIIVIGESELSKLIEDVIERLNEKHSENVSKRWLNPKEAMLALGIKSRTTLQRLRDTGAVRFSQPAKKIILYDLDSIEEYLEKNVRETF
jgi:hypothetical protein